MTDFNTMKEYIENCEKVFELKELDLDNMSQENMQEYADFIDYMWTTL